MTTLLLPTLPWVTVMAFLALFVRLPKRLPPSSPTPSGDAADAGGPDLDTPGSSGLPRVSVVVPARNEAGNVERVLRSLAASDWPKLEIVLVDDRSEDETGAIARRVGAEIARAGRADVRVISGRDLPAGWLGKPWACMQGARAATGELLLFTDADTRHGPDLLRRAVAELRASGADALTLAGRQLMETFWEKVVQPQIFTTMLFRYWNQRDRLRPGQWRGAIANGQYILFERTTYEAIGGHEAVRGEVVEDLRMAQHLVRTGHALELRMAEDAFATRMYESLGDIVRGWSKNVVLGGLATIPPGPLRRLAPPAMVLGGFVLWLLPVLLLIATAATGSETTLQTWSASVVALSVLFWGLVSSRMGVSPVYGAAYPLGAAVGMYIFLRAWMRGGDVEWKGRRYRVRGVSAAGEPGGLD